MKYRNFVSKLGSAPSGWERLRLAQIANMKSGDAITAAHIEEVGDFPVYGGNGVRGYHNKYNRDGELSLIGRQGALCGAVHHTIGKIFASEHAVVCDAHQGYNQKLLSYILHALELNELSEASAQPGLSVAKLLKLEVIVPSSEGEQASIAEALSDADALIEGLERLIAKKRLIKQGAMQDLLTAKRRLPGFSGEWSNYTLFDLADGSKKNFDDGDWIEAEHIAPRGVRLVQTGNIGIGEFIDDSKKYIFETSFETLKCKEVFTGDVLICRLADPPGRACIVPNLGEDKVITSVDVTIFRPSSKLSVKEFLIYAMSQPEWLSRIDELSGGTTRKRIARSRLAKMTLNLPCMEEQRAIASVLLDMDAEIKALETRLDKARQVKEGMMQNLLTGRIRLV